MTSSSSTSLSPRTLGGSGIRVPALGIGIASWGSSMLGYGQTFGRNDVLAAYQAALDADLAFFDTAASYGAGQSEELLGELHQKDGRPIVIATKYSNPTPLDPNHRQSPATGLLPSLDASLKRLRVDCVDLFQLHYPPRDIHLDETLWALAQAVRTGKARAVGVSNFNAARMRRAHRELARQGVTLASNQVAFNMLMRYPEVNGLLKACAELDVALIAYTPQANGVLTGKRRRNAPGFPLMQQVYFRLNELDSFQEGRGPRSFWRRLVHPHPLDRDRLERLFIAMDRIARAHQGTIGQVSLNWLLRRHPNVVAIPGAKSARHVQEAAGALTWQLSDAELEHLNQVLPPL